MKVLVMGGTRLFGRSLVWRLLHAGHEVTVATRGQAKDDFGHLVRRVIIDRRNAPAMHAAFEQSGDFDVIYDQLCYSPLDAAIASEVFAERTGRYVMTSTIEVYQPLLGQDDHPFTEAEADLAAEQVEWDYPWHKAGVSDTKYSAGKRQAEAAFLQDGRLPVVMARMGHVLAGQEDFTLRTQQYVEQAVSGGTPKSKQCQMPSSFILSEIASSALHWLGMNSMHLGALNVAQFQATSVGLLNEAAKVAGIQDRSHALESMMLPFDYDAPFCMDLGLLIQLGWEIPPYEDDLARVFQQHLVAYRLPEGAKYA
ncbi:NAD-dependent epimerase/dehydratase family protein [Leeia aquatica]|uniref:NAD-dependent epimerase/dehydratase family protein n=1 Tax=Leeia aquatica TaxID=2725557 RepID=A0A847S8B5_9NEIS|nr:NAD-dependent epimerase/dehydratase family protein [Leeia aquatica]NLR76003.1 NAD-dependent epimerase/dehydratase family protein [Leeia aquatica]